MTTAADEAGMTQRPDLGQVAEEVKEVRGRQLPRYPAYKPSGVQWLDSIPEHWSVRRLKFIGDVRTSNVDKKSAEDEETVRLCNYIDVYHNEYITADIAFMTATATPEEIRRFHLHAGDVLITKDSEEWNDIAVPAFVDEPLGGVVCGYHLAQIRPMPGRMFGEYLFRAFASRALREQFHVRANGITRFGLSRDAITSAWFPIPPKEEQAAITRFLRRETTEIDALIARKRRLIELLKEKRTALISHAVTKGLNPKAPMKPSGIDWLGDVPAHWEFRKLGFMTKMRGGATPSKNNEAYWTGSIPWVSPKDMKVREILDSEDHLSQMALDETTLTLFDPPIVLMVVRGMILVHTFPVGITRVPVTINQDMKALAPDNGCLHEYLLNLLDGISHIVLGIVEESAHGTKVLRTNLWKHLGVFLPGEDEQAVICRHISELNTYFDGLVGKTEHAIDRLSEYRSALISAAVTGKIDVRQEVA